MGFNLAFKGLNDEALTKVCDLLKYIISVPVCHTHVYSTNTEIVDYFIIYFFN
jgi:hypothetical protein